MLAETDPRNVFIIILFFLLKNFSVLLFIIYDALN